MNIRLLGAHNCESQNTRLISLLIDDVLAVDAGGLTSGLSFAEQQQLRAVLLTHQHYDHIRDIPALGMNFFLAGSSISVYATSPVYDVLVNRLLDGQVYSKFLERPPENPAIRFTVIEPYRMEPIAGYDVIALPVKHSVPAVGYQVTSPEGKAVFYTGDTGPGLADCWQYASPQLLIIEVTAPNRFDDFGRESGHLTPNLLRQELVDFRQVKGYLPRVVTVHMSPGLEEEIRVQLAVVSEALGCLITPGYEGMQIDL